MEGIIMILIRADANEQIGTGHVMRCLSVAHALAERRIDVSFVTADHRGDRLIQQNGFLSFCLDSEWTKMEGEINAIESLIEVIKPSLFLIDSYYVTNKYMSTVSRLVKTAYFDDMNEAHWKADVLINYNIYSSVLKYDVYDKTHTKLLLGPQYAPLREEFYNCKKHEIKDVTNIMISAGGADPEHVTEKIMESISPEHLNIRFHFVVGALNPRLSEIKKKAENNTNVVLHINERHMSDLMKKCDLAISAAGTTLYELCATGIPTITYILADNQLLAAEKFDKEGIMSNAGDCRGNVDFIGNIEKILQHLIGNINLRKEMSYQMQVLVDGNGATRLVEQLC